MKRKRLFAVILLLLTLTFASACSKAKNQPAGEMTSDGNRLHYEVHGSGQQTLLFIHGWSNTHHVWDRQVQAFSQDHRVVLVDLPGYGQSKNERGSWTMSSFAKDVSGLINHLDLKEVILVGFSMGGPVSIETAKLAPQKIMGIVLVDILQNPETTYSDKMIESITTTYMDAVTHPTLEKVRPFFKTKQDELGRRYIDMVKDAPKTGWRQSLHNCLVWLNRSSVDSVKSLEMPILAINADQYPTQADVFRKYHPAFKARIIKGAYHVVFWEKPEEFNRYLRESVGEIQQLSKNQ